MSLSRWRPGVLGQRYSQPVPDRGLLQAMKGVPIVAAVYAAPRVASPSLRISAPFTALVAAEYLTRVNQRPGAPPNTRVVIGPETAHLVHIVSFDPLGADG